MPLFICEISKSKA